MNRSGKKKIGSDGGFAELPQSLVDHRTWQWLDASAVHPLLLLGDSSLAGGCQLSVMVHVINYQKL